jgi:hypothetical protein
MSLLAASITKSCVEGLLPISELTPVFSPATEMQPEESKPTEIRLLLMLAFSIPPNEAENLEGGDKVPVRTSDQLMGSELADSVLAKNAELGGISLQRRFRLTSPSGASRPSWLQEEAHHLSTCVRSAWIGI